MAFHKFKIGQRVTYWAIARRAEFRDLFAAKHIIQALKLHRIDCNQVDHILKKTRNWNCAAARRKSPLNSVALRAPFVMAEFLDGHAWLWKYVYEEVERDPEFNAMVDRALGLCIQNIPRSWHQAVREAKENHPHILELRRRLC